MKYFQDCTNLNDAKKRYYELVKLHHPDRGGDTAIMQEINNAYAFICAKLARGENVTDEEVNTAIEEAEAYREAINAIINLQEITIEVVGAWIWVTGNTQPHSGKGTGILPGAGYHYASKKCAWYFRTDEYKVRNRTKMSLDEIRNKYGSRVINSRPRQTLNA